MIDPVELALRATQTAGLMAVHLLGPVRATLECLDDSDLSMSLPFNPESFQLTRRAPVSAGDGVRFAGLEPSAGTNDTLNFDTWLDASDASTAVAALSAVSPYTPNIAGESKSILEDMEALYQLTVPRIPSDAGPEDLQGRVPVVAFLWNDFKFIGVITNVSFDVRMFDPLGAPRRARVSVSMEGRAFVDADIATVLHDTESAESFGTSLPSVDVASALKEAALILATRLL